MNVLAHDTIKSKVRPISDRTLSASPAASTLFFPFADDAILFRPSTRRIWFLNKTAAVIWCLLEEHFSLPELVVELSRRFAIDQHTAERDVGQILAYLRREGLLQEGGPGSAECSREDAVTAPFQGPEVAAPHAWCLCQSIRLSGLILEFCCQDAAIGRSFSALLQHLEDKERPVPDTRLWVLPNRDLAGGWDICLDGRRCFAALPAGEVLPHLLTLTFIAASRNLKDKLLLHAAVLINGGVALLLPAVAGSGKTTLAAALAARGWTLYSDELAVVDPQDLRLSPLPLPMSIKSGSVAALAPFYPELATRMAYLRADGKLVRYLLPSVASLPVPGEAALISQLIFPRFSAESPGQAARLTSLEALQRLAATGSSDRELTSADIRALIAIVENCPCHSLEYSELGQGLEQIKDLTAGMEMVGG